MTQRLMIYGATGYTGRLLAQAATDRGIPLTLAGRNRAALERLAAQYGAEFRVFELDDAAVMHKAMKEVACVINSAGPFWNTARPVIGACIESGAHYLDVTGEIDVFQYAEERSEDARAHDVMLMPGVGWDVIPTDCLALHTAQRVKNPQKVRLLIRHVDLVVTRGSMRTVTGFAKLGNLVRRDGILTALPESPSVEYDLGLGLEPYRISPMPDVITTWKTTGIPNIEVYGPGRGPRALPSAEQIEAMPEGGNEEQTKRAYALGLAEVTGADGSVARSMIRTISGYAYTGVVGVEVAHRILQGDYRPGFQSPASVYGAGLATSVGEGKITDLD